MSAVRRVGYVDSVQQGLFDQAPETDWSADPYGPAREAGRRLASEFAIGDEQGFELILSFGSETAARRALVQRWYRNEVELREQAA